MSVLGAAGYMLVAVLAWSLLPLAVSLSGGSLAPFLYGAWFCAGASSASLAFLLIFHRLFFLDHNALCLIARRIFLWPDSRFLAVGVMGAFGVAFFPLSVRFVNVMVSAVLHEVYPIFLVLFLGWLFRDDGRYRRFTPGAFLPFLLSLAGGVVLAVASQTGDFMAIFLGWKSAVGVALVLAGALGSNLCVFGLRWGVSLADELSCRREDIRSLELGCAVLALFITNLVSVAFNSVVGMSSGERIEFPTWGVAAFNGAFAAVGAFAMRKANLVTDNLGINAMVYFIPVLSLLLLLWIAGAEVVRLDYLAIGATAIILSNLLVVFSPAIRGFLRMFRRRSL